MTSTTETQDRGVQGKVVNNGFRPQAYTVLTDSYVRNGITFGSNVAAIAADVLLLEANTLRTANSPCQTKASIRRHGATCEFEITIALNSTVAAPAITADSELRIRPVQPLLAGQPGRYLTRLPRAANSYVLLPVFDDVQIARVSTIGAAAPVNSTLTANHRLRARLLTNGDIALFERTTTAAIPLEIGLEFDASVAPLYAGTPANTCILITVRGSYRIQAPVNPAI